MRNSENRNHRSSDHVESKSGRLRLLDLAGLQGLPLRSPSTGVFIALTLTAMMPWLLGIFNGAVERTPSGTETTTALNAVEDKNDASTILAMVIRPGEQPEPGRIDLQPQNLRPDPLTAKLPQSSVLRQQAESDGNNNDGSHFIPMLTVAPEMAEGTRALPSLLEEYPRSETPLLPPDSLTAAQPPANPPADYPRATESRTIDPPVAESPVMQSMGPGVSDELNFNRMDGSLLAEQSARHRAMRLENLARSADLRTRHAFELAGRGAMFAARREFIESLRILSQGLDAEYKTGRHGRALAEGLRAIEEVDDFMPDGSVLDAELNVRRIVEGHRTEVLKTAALDRIVPLAAIRSYMTFAQQRIADAMGTEAAGSMALRGLAKLYDTLSVEQSDVIKAGGAKAMVLYQAALLVRKENYLAANDLGVLLARSGRDSAARDVLVYAASIRRDPIVVSNLAALNRRLGESDRAAALAREAAVRAAQERQTRLAGGDMRDLPAQWVDESELIGMPTTAGTASPIGNPYPAVNRPSERLSGEGGSQPAVRQVVRPAAGQAGAQWSGPPSGSGNRNVERTYDNIAPQRTWVPITDPNYRPPSDPVPWYRNTRIRNIGSVIN